MNKINKFRGQAITGEWLYGSLIVFGERTFIYPKNGSQEDYHFYGYEVNPNTVGQFTGKKDPNGVDIFEDDIMQHANPLDITFAVNWDEDFLGFVFDSGTTSYNITDPSFYVIGNIYENPELLNAAN